MTVSGNLAALHGIALRELAAPHLATLGQPSLRKSSPPGEDGSCFGHYVWREAVPPLALLTWIQPDGEWVWGVRVIGVGPADPQLGFGVGANRCLVLERMPDVRIVDPTLARLVLDDGSLDIVLAGDLVAEIRLQAPLS